MPRLTVAGMEVSEYNRQYHLRHKSRLNTRARDRARRLKEEAYRLLGGVCACGEADHDTLTIDHIKEIKRTDVNRHYSSTPVYYDIVMGRTPLHEVQLLCANCHIKKTRAFLRGKIGAP